MEIYAMFAPVAPPPHYFLGLDLGQAVDFSALVALERREPEGRPVPGRRRYRYEVRGVKRWALRTPYLTIAADVAKLVEGPPLAGCVLGIDKTGVGAGVVEVIVAARPKATIRPVLITGGYDVTTLRAEVHVPKMELVAAVTAILESDRLAIPATIPEGKTLGKELQSFRARVTLAGNETAEADWRTRAHDDLVLALAIAAWLGEHDRPARAPVSGGEPSPSFTYALANGADLPPPDELDGWRARREQQRGF
jgi:hypothetical protein